jgi:hypothetical protein
MIKRKAFSNKSFAEILLLKKSNLKTSSTVVFSNTFMSNDKSLAEIISAMWGNPLSQK